MVMGTDGNGRHVQSKNKNGSVTITLQHGSPSAATFMALDAIGEPFPIIVKDNSSLGTLFMTSDAMLSKIPDLNLGATVGEVEWVFNFISGNTIHSAAKEY
jgi:hypothetical protein